MEEQPNTQQINLDFAARIAELEQQRTTLQAQVEALRAACQVVVAHRNIFGPYCPLCMQKKHDAACMYGIALLALAITGEE